MQEELADLREEANSMKMQWETEKKKLMRFPNKRAEIDKAKHELEDAENNYDLERAAVLRHGTIPQLEHELKELKKRTLKITSKWYKNRLLKTKLRKWSVV